MSTKKDILKFFRLKGGILKILGNFNNYYTNPDNDYLFEEFIGNLYNTLQAIRELDSFLGDSFNYSSLLGILDTKVEIPEHLSRRFSFDETYYDLFRHSRNMDGHLDKINKSNELLIAKGMRQDFYNEIIELIIEIHDNRVKNLSGEEINIYISSPQYTDSLLDPYRKLLIDSKALDLLGDHYPHLKQVLEFEPNEDNVSFDD